MTDIEHLAKSFEDFKEERNRRNDTTDKLLQELVRRVEILATEQRRLDRIDKQIEDIYARLWKIAIVCSTIAASAGFAINKIF